MRFCTLGLVFCLWATTGRGAGGAQYQAYLVTPGPGALLLNQASGLGVGMKLGDTVWANIEGSAINYVTDSANRYGTNVHWFFHPEWYGTSSISYVSRRDRSNQLIAQISVELGCGHEWIFLTHGFLSVELLNLSTAVASLSDSGDNRNNYGSRWLNLLVGWWI